MPDIIFLPKPWTPKRELIKRDCDAVLIKLIHLSISEDLKLLLFSGESYLDSDQNPDAKILIKSPDQTEFNWLDHFSKHSNDHYAMTSKAYHFHQCKWEAITIKVLVWLGLNEYLHSKKVSKNHFPNTKMKH